MKTNAEKLPSPWVSAIPLAVLTGLLYVVIRAFGGEAINGGSQIALLSATSVCVMLSIGIYRCRWAVLEEAIIDNIRASASAIVILLRVGAWYRDRLRTVSGPLFPGASDAVSGLSPRRIRRALLILTVLVFSKYFYMACMTNFFTFFLMERFGISVQASQYCLFAFLAAAAAGTVIGGPVGDRIGRKYVIWVSILGAAPFALLLPYAGLAGTIVLAVVVGLVISSAFSAILVYATDLMPGKVGMIAGVFFGLMFGLGGLGSAFFGWLADRTSIEFIFRVSTLLPLLGIITGFLPNIELKRDEK